MVGVGEHLLERQARVVESPRARERLHVPEGADREGALIAAEPVGRCLGVVAVNQAVGDELAGDRVECGEPARIGGGYELDERHEQQ